MTNAFDWKKYTDEEREKRGDLVKTIDRNNRMSMSSSRAVKKLQETRPYHGTIVGISEKADQRIFADRRYKINRDI